MQNMKKMIRRGIILIIATIMIFSIFPATAPVVNAAEVVRLDVYPNPSYGGIATAKMGESVSTAYYNNGDTVTIKAEARDGYVFIRWRSSADDTISSSAEYSFIITEDMDLTAEFGSTVNSDFSGGSGTKNNPYLIDNVENLFMINSYPDKYFKQISNIDLKDYTNIDSIGKGGTLFTGNYDGNGKTIKNLKMHRPDDFNSAFPESYYVGLFNIGENGVVQDLKIENASIRATGIAGILAGINQGEIIDCHVDGSVHVTHNNQGAGGLVGKNSNIIRDCSAKGDVTGKNEMGGLVGQNTCDGTTGSIQDSYANVTVITDNCGGGLVGINENNAVIETSFAKGNLAGYWQLGGLVGINNGEISNCYATGEVNGSDTGEIFGGFTAFNGGLISNAYSIGHVSGTTDAGGFVGINNDDGIIQNCYYDVSTSGKSDEGKGEPKHTAGLLEQNTYNTWDFSNTWTKQSNTYPYFDWQTSNFPTAEEVLTAPTLTLDSVGSQCVNLSWTEVPGVTEYKVYQGTQTGTYEEVLTASALSCTIDELINNTTYYFAVKATNENSESLYSNEVTATPQEIVAYSVTFTVSDTEGGPILGAAVSIGGQQKVTDAYGTAVLQLSGGNYSYSVSKTGYVTSISLGLSITKDSMYSVTLNSDSSSTLTAVIDETPNGGAVAGVEMDFNASKSTAAGVNSIVIFAWDFGDGTVSLGEQVSHTYDSVGQYTVKLTVTDDKGNKASDEKAINITALTNQDKQDVLADTSALEIADYLVSRDTIDSVTKNFTVPLVGVHGTTIVWSETSDYVVIDPLTGLVEITRPETVNLVMATINVTVSKGSASDGKGYMIYIPKKEPDMTEVVFEDEDLLKFLCDDLGYDIDNDGKIVKEEAMRITRIASSDISEWMTNYAIDSLVGLEECENLEELILTNYDFNPVDSSVNVNIRDLEPIKELSKLRGLSVSGNLTNTPDLSKLTSLEELYLQGGTQFDASSVFSITSLKKLSLEYMGITNIANISGLTNLTELHLKYNAIKDIEELSVMSGKLEKLELTGNPLNNENTLRATHLSTKDFMVDGVTYEVWVVKTNNNSSGGGSGNSTLKEPLKEKPLSQRPGADKNSKVEEVAKVEISQDLVKKTGDKVFADLSKLDLTKELSGLINKEDENGALNTVLKPLVSTESKITLNIPGNNNAKGLEVVLPRLEKVFEQVDRVSLESDIASFEIKKDTFGELGNDGIKLSATILDKESLPVNVRESMPEGVNEVIDLNAYVKGQKISNFNSPIKVSMPYTLKEGEDPEKVCVYLLNDNGQIEKVAGVYDVARGKIIVKRKHFSMYFIGVSSDTFSDIQNSWVKHPVEVLAGKGIITGKSGGLYDLNGLTTRAEFVSLIARMLSLEPKEGQDVFMDVYAEAWYAESVKAMYQTGIIKGNTDMTFAPEQTITREEVAVILSNTLNYLGLSQTEDNSDSQFADKKDISSWAAESVAHVYNRQLMNGYPTGDFRPLSNLNRAEMAQIMYKLFNLYNY